MVSLSAGYMSSFTAYWVRDSPKVDLSISENVVEAEQTPPEVHVEDTTYFERLRQQSKETIEKFMTTFHTSFHNPSSSTLSPITISDSSPFPSTSSNPPVLTSSLISSRTRSRDPSTCEHKCLVWWEITLDGIIKKCDWCYQNLKNLLKILNKKNKIRLKVNNINPY